MEECVYGPLREEWRDVVGYEGHYKISNYGLVKSLERPSHNADKKRSSPIVKEKILSYGKTGFRKDRKTQKNYLQVVLTKNRKMKSAKVHVIMHRAFFIYKDGEQLNHKNSITEDNFILNFEVVNSRENRAHAILLNANRSSKYIGVTRRKKCWEARINIKSKCIHIGYYSTEEEAGQAYIDYLNENGIINRYATLKSA